ncbi:Alpha/Beta hydrolase protein [Rhodocollybia butyracea]|uniref:Alpha/Beta hydrolase protein n=1 Tax=Rhodocollybia butyracea TaxID=206335 RepID=A0A9P5U359_9AGAR|nr:Alpha/Beta hydrolase protein [Rhodocollybia butyracea]
MTILGFAVLAILLPFAVASPSPHIHSRNNNDVPIIDLGYAKYQGVFDSLNNVTSYLGMRYAAPPTGELRFRAPQAPANDDGVVQQANANPIPCFQAVMGTAPTNPLEAINKRQSVMEMETEDCLFLNTYFPGDTVPTEPLPVLVWIHGGGYTEGDALMFNGSDLMTEAHNEIVLVIIQYRLGLFGFLPGSEVKENGDLNAGILDQHFALRWIQSHISKFGGDPTKVTIWGESAGAGSAIQHIVAQDGQTSPQLFRGAITSSTSLPSQYLYNDTVPELLYSEIVAQTNCNSVANSLACLRSVDANTLGAINANITAGGFFGTFVFGPVVDGTFIKQRPIESLKQGKVNGKAILAITNTNEGHIFVNQYNPMSASVYASMLFPKFGPRQAEQTAELYANLGTPIEQNNLIMGDSIFICPTFYLLSAFPKNAWKVPIPPAHHGQDIIYYFTSQPGGPPFNNTQFLEAFQGGFLAFVVSQNPNDKIAPTVTPPWELYSEANTVMLFNKTFDNNTDPLDDGTSDSTGTKVEVEKVRGPSSVDNVNAVPIIDLGYAKYQGVFDSLNNVTNYLGIRYAAPPTANAEPIPCFQAGDGIAPTNPLEAITKRQSATETEDCLFLNTYFPGSTVPTKPLPVLVWIHGGGYVGGDAAQFTGSDLMTEAHNEIVLVIIQYRLGVFGFLPGSEVKENGELNAGLRAGSVLQHIVARDGQTSPQLFRGAMTSSTFLPSQYLYNDTVPELLFSEVVTQTNCTSAADALACLRSVDANTLGTINANIGLEGFFGTFLFVPVVDGSFIRQRPTESLKQGKVNGKALLSITNTNEGTVFVNQADPMNASVYASMLFPNLGSQEANQAAQLYADLGTPLVQNDLIMGDSIFICPTFYLLSAFPQTSWKVPIPPATHGEDVEYYFTSQGTPSFNNTQFLQAFQGGFMAFVVSQNPNDKVAPTITPSWELYSVANTEMLFNRTVGDEPDIQATPIPNDQLSRCNFWESVGALTGQ